MPFFFDIEIYPNYFLALFRRFSDGKTYTIQHPVDRNLIFWIMENNETVGFNSIYFDMPMLFAAAAGYDNETLKEIADTIIRDRAMPWHIEDMYGFDIPRKLDHVDLINVAPGMASLKLYNGRLHGNRMQDLPYQPDQWLTEDQKDDVYRYCFNDLEATYLLWKNLEKPLVLRDDLTWKYGTDLMSKSDAQVAEAILRQEIKRHAGFDPRYVKAKANRYFFYSIPDFISFENEQLKQILSHLEETPFSISSKGKVDLPKYLRDPVTIGSGVYRMGIGGLHSSEQNTYHLADDGRIVDRDVTSYYPAIILNLGLYPEQIGKDFLTAYRELVETRIAAKKAGDKSTADSLKIAVNGTFGKLGSPYSFLYSPRLLIQTTLTGQLSLLMLIEWIEASGNRVLSANTDGLVTKVYDEAAFEDIIARWEQATGFETEETEYAALYSRDVNNYIAVKTDGEVKTKGAYSEPGMMKNPHATILSRAVISCIRDGLCIRDVIRQSRDLTEFVIVRTVQGGALKDGEYLGKAIRWYYSVETDTPIVYSTTGNKVPMSEGAKPVMTWPDTFPDDIDYDRYIREAMSILTDLRYYPDVIG